MTLKNILSIIFIIPMLALVSNNLYSQTTNTYGFTGSSEFFTVPACTDSLELEVGGAQGGGPTGGAGALINATIPVNPGDQIEIIVGGQGGCGNNSGGFNGGGTSYASYNPANQAWDGCGGGGATTILVNGVPVIIAGAGGGTGGGSTASTNNGGGDGGCASGEAGDNSFGDGGGGGTQTAGGTGGTPWSNTPPGGSNGSLNQGGQGGQWDTASGGGGGGGYYGGGGGGNDGCCTNGNGAGGGGGGSSLVPPNSGCIQGGNNGDGSVEMTFVEGSFDEDITPTSCLGASDGEIIISTDQANSEFSFDGGQTYSTTDSILSDIPSGDYVVCVEFNAGSCQSACDTVTVPDGPPIDANAGNDTTICENGTAELWAQGVQGNTFTYEWSHTTDNSNEVEASPVTDTSIWVIAQNELTCRSDTLWVDIDMFPPIGGNVSPDDYVCPGFEGMLSVNASGGIGGPYSYEWTSPSGGVISDSASMVDNPMDTTTYYVTITDECESSPLTLEGNINTAPIPEVDFSVEDDIKCEPGIFSLSNETDLTNIASYEWVINRDTLDNIANFDIGLAEPGTYNVKMVIETVDGCFDSLEVSDFLTVSHQPIANFEYHPDPVGYLEPRVELLNSSQYADFYDWYIEAGSPSYSDEVSPFVNFPEGEVGEYEVTLVAHSDLDCNDTITKIVEVAPEVALYVPNSFTPDNDGINDTWRPHIEGINVQDFNLLVFNRWGEIMWESKDPEASWDGTYGGRKVKPGTYIWKISAGDAHSDEKFEWQGHVNIMY